MPSMYCFIDGLGEFGEDTALQWFRAYMFSIIMHGLRQSDLELVTSRAVERGCKKPWF